MKREWPEAFWLNDLPLDQTLEFYRDYLAEAASSEETYRYARATLGKNDLFFLLTNILHRTEEQMLHPWTFERCREVQNEPDGMLDLWARDHYKSTIITFGMTTLDIINDPEITIGVFSHTKDISKDFVTQLKMEFESNKDLVDLYPDIFFDNPKVQSPQWSVEAITVKRKSNPKESTVEAHGLVKGMPTSKHFKLRIYDDVVTKESIGTPDQIQKTTAAFRLSSNLGMTGGRVRGIGTRYHQFDTYHTIEKEGILKVRKHPATLTGKDAPSDLKLGVLKSEEELREKRRDQGSYIFGAQMLLNPNADKTMGFNKEDMRYWEVKRSAGNKMWRAIIVDPSSGKNKSDGQQHKRDYTCMYCVGLGGDNHWRILDIVRDKLPLPKRQEFLEQMHRDWKPHAVFYEETGFEADHQYIKLKEEENVYRMNVIPIRWSIGKDDRIMALQPLFEEHRIIFPKSLVRINYEGVAVDLTKAFVDEELEPWPVLAHDDMLDDLANLLHPELQQRIKLPKAPNGNREELLRKLRRQQRKNRPIV